ncbi:MAG TPA: nuclease [Phenylobacterium sp.]|uniref:nuclease n=1 Tax=Phenylobacterium sp. TaxID=1871053 RepID=UPI002C12A884|nr:nuclease [Phenylobacterium sp.]HSV03657.1 nuclease [Phenylobacterium sp.]
MTPFRALLFPLALALALAGCGRAPEPRPAAAPPAPLSERVKVLNGDVLTVDGEDLRLADAYAPQPIPDARCWAEALAAREAAGELRTLIAEGRAITVKRTGQRDEYNRALAYVTLDRLDLGDTLYAMGLAARRGQARFRWCAGFSEETAGAPTLQSLMGAGR